MAFTHLPCHMQGLAAGVQIDRCTGQQQQLWGQASSRFRTGATTASPGAAVCHFGVSAAAAALARRCILLFLLLAATVPPAGEP